MPIVGSDGPLFETSKLNIKVPTDAVPNFLQGTERLETESQVVYKSDADSVGIGRSRTDNPCQKIRYSVFTEKVQEEILSMGNN